MPLMSSAIGLPRPRVPSLLRPRTAAAQPWRPSSIHLQRAGRRLHKLSCPVVSGTIMGLSDSEGSPEASTGGISTKQVVGEIRGGRKQQQKLYRKDEVTTDELPKNIDAIRTILRSVGDGEISVSAYDTAWVALVKNKQLNDGPQFPSSIDWIARNQLPDGSWGDQAFFLVHDRVINTLACVVALMTWNIHVDKCEKGLSFIRENLWRLEDSELEEWMVIGFELTFPQLLEMANDLGLDLPYNDPSLQAIYAQRDLKLTRIPKEVLHAVPTTLLFSLEGMRGLDWKKLINLQSSDGSFLASPASTAYALMETGDAKCLRFLDEIVHKFNGGVPTAYPVDLFEHLWVVDRLERLGISRYFASETEECLEYVYRHWSVKGLSYTRDNPVNDVDDTAMGFRLLRLHGYRISSRVFRHFEEEGEFYCYPGQTNESVTAMYNLYRAAQVAFPGEDELVRAHIYCRRFLADRRASNKLNDKWVIPKDLPGEVGYALDLPWKASLPRIETRMYLEQYGGSSEVWIGKSLYRMYHVSNDLYLHTAKADFTNFQKLCRLEWHALKMWCSRKNLEMFGVTSEKALRDYFMSAASIFEPDRAAERLGWARTAVVAGAVSSHLRRCAAADSYLSEWFVAQLTTTTSSTDRHCYNDVNRGRRQGSREDVILLDAVHGVIDLLASDDDDDASSDGLRQAWKHWFMAWTTSDDEGKNDAALALLLVRTVEICSGRHHHHHHHHHAAGLSDLEKLTSSICSKLHSTDGEGAEKTTDSEVDVEMQELTQHVLLEKRCSGGGVSTVTRHTFLHVVRSFCYVAHCSPETIDGHISKVMFEDVI